MEDQAREFVLYLRKSKGRAGIARQRRDCLTHAGRIGAVVIGEFIDTDRTAFAKVGQGSARREDYAELIETLREDARPLPLGVIAWHADRLLRDPAQAEAFIAICAEGRHPVETPRSGSYDLATPTGRKRLRSDVIDAAYEVDHAIERIEAAKTEAASEGRWLGGPRPFGYEADGVTIRTSEAAELKASADAVLSGMTMHAVTKDWNRRGVLTSTGRQWKPGSTREVFLRARNAGIMRHRDAEVGPAQWPAILEESVWRGLVALLKDPARRTTPGPARRWLGSGLYECGICVDAGAEKTALRCGYSSVHKVGKVRQSIRTYLCPGNGDHVAREAGHLDRYVGMIVVERLSRPGAGALFEGGRDDTAAQARIIDREALRARDQEAAEMFADGLMSRAQFATINDKISRRRAELDQADRAGARITALSPFRQGDPATVWEGLDLDRKRAVIRQLMRVIVLPGVRGRPKGWTPEYGKEWGYFNPSRIRIDWRTAD